MTNVPMLIYEFPSSSLRCRANPNLFRRSFEPFEQMLYHRMMLEHQKAYPVPAGTRYILLTVQKTVFGLDIFIEMILLQLLENGFNLGDFRKMNRFDEKAYKLPPPTPAHVPAETNKRPLEQQPGPSSKKNRVFITPVIRPPVLIARHSTALSTSQPILLPDPPVQLTPQILLPDPPLVVETLEPTLMDASSIDQIMSSVFGDISQLPPAHTQEPQLLDTVSSQFDESNDLISFLDSFEKGLAIQQQEAPMDLTMPRRKKKSFGSDLEQRGRVEILSSGSPSLSPSLGGLSTSNYGCVQFGFYRLSSSRRRVRDMVDVVGRLGNASSRTCPLANGGSPTFEAGFGKTRAVLA
ncbi:uncharacterized protein TNCV_2176131 [Trichonephila clavipes]|uniref:Uncharacterized protein n=1 Tax=Trichonephila clavipes TaxID=2585209 RepID=A0A8X6V4X9_TRICX|nr:uncharacterized protein TNCV_2176131 [Trichonephila clavipes]